MLAGRKHPLQLFPKRRSSAFVYPLWARATYHLVVLAEMEKTLPAQLANVRAGVFKPSHQELPGLLHGGLALVVRQQLKGSRAVEGPSVAGGGKKE